ncbi:PTS sugar transporter subunit IIA, partial [Helcococcus ovis]
EKIVEDLESKFNIEFPMDEVYYITMHLLGTKLIINNNKNNKILDEDEKIKELAFEIVKEVEKVLRYDLLEDKELLASIALHLKPAIYRYKNNMNIRNPLLSSIKINYPFVYEASSIASDVIYKKTGIIFNEDELGYIAIHLGAAIERAKLNIKPIRTLLVCTTGIGSSRLLKYKLDSIFSNQLEIVDTTELYNIKNYINENLDLIISTVPFSMDLDVPIIFIYDILGESNFEDIKNFIYKKSNNKKCTKYLKKEDIYLGLDFENKEDVIRFLSDEIVKKGKTPDTLYENIMKRENIISTAFGNLVAVPHPFEPISNETFLTMGVLKKTINWSGKKVQVVIILNVEKNSEERFEEMYRLLLELIDRKESVERIIKSKSKEEIIDLISR